ncbi:hypothetical protein QKC54_gp0707 [Megavirus baoshan]|uniref:Uncharacterized protein n=1 Tax=Megavirus baoshan TaxID=2496520 RepID=A0A3Q8U7Q1_9VIRU|nr:hypothetical protein QKC54_gp0707 [Megavirus baoshan]AZL89135.1 hypothetical protein Mb0365 [Megavirus baoshan]
MNKDPEYFLQKARHFYNKAKNNITNEIDSDDEFLENNLEIYSENDSKNNLEIDSENDSEIDYSDEYSDEYPEFFSDNKIMSNINPIYNTVTDDNNVDYEEINSDEVDNEEVIDTESESEYEYIKLEPINIENLIDEKLKKIPKIKSRYTRFYDPVSRHYFGIDKIFDNKTSGIRPENKTTKTWYPENPLSYNYTRDPKTGKIYRTVKTYDDKGNYANKFKEVKRRNIKKPGTTYVVPMYKS